MELGAPVLSRFSEVEETLEQLGVEPNSVDGAILDCGCSSMQFDDPSRGFGLSTNGPLDMRMDAERYPNEPTAADVVNSLDYESLARILKVYGEEKKAKKVAQAIVDSRFMMRSIDTTWELAQLVETALSDGLGERRDMLGRPTHLATKTFMALRIFVNDELNELNHALTVGRRLLRPGGRLAVLSFHSLEDRLVKRHFQTVDLMQIRPPIVERATKRPSDALFEAAGKAQWPFVACEMAHSNRATAVFCHITEEERK
ncbi:12S rRNA N4-methylcytidine methyltransferase [Ixodes scapularis]